jgi:hypothetical protein
LSYLILPGVFVFGLLLIPVGIWIKRRSLRASGELPGIFPAIDLKLAGGAAHLGIRGRGDRSVNL